MIARELFGIGYSKSIHHASDDLTIDQIRSLGETPAPRLFVHYTFGMILIYVQCPIIALTMGSSYLAANRGKHIQVFVYRTSVKNHDATAGVLQELAKLFKKHGTLDSDFYLLGSREVFSGFTGLDRIIGTPAGDEVWVEIDHYVDDQHRKKVVDSIGKDEASGPIFGRLMGLISEKYSVVMADLDQVSTA